MTALWPRCHWMGLGRGLLMVWKWVWKNEGSRALGSVVLGGWKESGANFQCANLEVTGHVGGDTDRLVWSLELGWRQALRACLVHVISS